MPQLATSTRVGDRPEIGVMTFGTADLRLSGRQWGVILLFVLGAVLGLPLLWKRVERFETGPDYRIPYALSRDYWLYSRRSDRIDPRTNIVLIGDSVIWGEYVRADGTWSHWLNRESDGQARFVNGGVNGLFPLALEGLVAHFAHFKRGQKVMVHCNLLWMTSPQADLTSDKEEHFNHTRLVPQFRPWLPSYRADTSERMAHWIGVRTPFLGFVDHLQIAYFDQKSLPAWTLADDGSDPPHFPNLTRNPLSQIGFQVPGEPTEDPQRGPESSRHKPWAKGSAVGTTSFDWVNAARSQQFIAFQRLTWGLRDKGMDVFVVVGPFNEHLLSETNRTRYRAWRGSVTQWLEAASIPHWVPDVLPSELYADASHPLTAGYQLLARETWAQPEFRKWADKR